MQIFNNYDVNIIFLFIKSVNIFHILYIYIYIYIFNLIFYNFYLLNITQVYKIRCDIIRKSRNEYGLSKIIVSTNSKFRSLIIGSVTQLLTRLYYYYSRFSPLVKINSLYSHTLEYLHHWFARVCTCASVTAHLSLKRLLSDN